MSFSETKAHRCRICGKEYDEPGEAARCAAKPIELIQYAVGDRVRNVDPRVCCGYEYHFVGTVIDVVGPMSADEQYEIDHLFGLAERLNSHVFRYAVSFRCGWCHRKEWAYFYAPELEAASSEPE